MLSEIAKDTEAFSYANLTAKDYWLYSGNLYGWITKPTNQLRYLRGLSPRLISDPFNSKQMTLQLIDPDGSLVRETTFPWDPARHRREIFYRSLSFRRPSRIELDAVEKISNPDVRAETLYEKKVLSYASSRFAQGVLDEQTIRQEDVYRFQKALERSEVLTGKIPLTSIDTMTGPGWSIDPTLLIPNPEIRSLKRFDHHHTTSEWIQSSSDSSRADLLDFALNSLLLGMKRTKDDFSRGMNNARAFAFSTRITSPDTSVNFHFLDLKHLKENHPNGSEAQWLNAHEDLQKYIAKVYQRDLAMNPKITEKLNRFTTENSDRIQYFFLSKEPSAIGIPYQKNDVPFPGQKSRISTEFRQTGTFDHFTVEGSFGIIYSTDPVTEPLSMESYADVRLDRKPGEKVAELIRFGIDPKDRDFGAKFMFKMSSYLTSVEGVSRVFAISEASYANKLIQNFGFRKIGARPSTMGHEEWIIEVTPDAFFERSVIQPPKK